MVILGSWRGKPLTISSKSNSLTVSIEADRKAEVFSFDASGRLWTALVDDVSYRRGLDGKIIARWAVRPLVHERRWLTESESRELIERASSTLRQFSADITSGAVQLNQPLPPEGLPVLPAAAAFTWENSVRDREGYFSVYKPVGILPPDQYMAVVLQASEGCSYNTCTFCDFYRDRPFRIKSPQDFEAHARAVRAFLGDGLSLRRTIFLGDANALVIPMPRLLPLMEIANREFDVTRLGGIFAFLDGFSGEKKSAADYAHLAALGLKRVYIGMESGSPELLEFLHKPGSADDVVRTVQTMKEGGVSVGIIILLGAGGRRYAAGHVHDTIRSVNQMGLDLDDLIYFSELVENENLPYVQDAFRSELLPLSPIERLTQQEQIESGLHFSEQGGVPHISRYDIREFVY